jgi:hypothetical protein
MDEATRPRSPGESRSASLDEVAELSRRVEALEAELRAMHSEVRTRRLVVVEEDGFERIIAAGRGDVGDIAVYGRPWATGRTCIGLSALDPMDGDGVHVALSMVDEGDIVAALELAQPGVPTFWTDEPCRS